MHELTNALFKELKNCKTKDEAIKTIIYKHNEIKSKLAAVGLTFFETGLHFSESIHGNQIISGDNNIYLAYFYDELNYIKYGLTIEWYSRIDNTDRYSEIQKATREIIDNLE